MVEPSDRSVMLFFTGVAWIVGRSLRVAAAMIFSLGLVPVCMLGGIGLLHIPVDIISAPATLHLRARNPASVWPSIPWFT